MDVSVSACIFNEENKVCTKALVTYYLLERSEFIKIVGDERIAEAYLSRQEG
ncbi:MAG: hypothetical protein IH874_01075 [Candidatus Dadabacteria bacterium]|nr:hypothetical protein [Candidatus Dadabacteria bacterium]